MKKRFFSTLAVGLATAGLLAGCQSSSTPAQSSDNGGKTTIDTLKVAFVPSRDPGEIVTVTEPLKELLKKELATKGYDVKNVDISVGTSFDAVGEALASGTADIGLIPGGTYVLFSDDVEVLLTATRDGLNKNSENPKDWNDGKETVRSEDQVTYYKGLVIAGPSEKGKALGEKINKGEELTWDDLNGASWGVMGTSSSSGYIYPTIWLQEKYGKNISDLQNVVQADSYASSAARLASGQVDIMVGYADLRRDYAKKWTEEYGRTASIWEETNVIGVTPDIYNDTVSVSKHSPIMDDKLKEAVAESFINIGQTPEGKEVIKIYSHSGYKKAKDSDYDNERKAQKIIKEFKAKNN